MKHISEKRKEELLRRYGNKAGNTTGNWQTRRPKGPGRPGGPRGVMFGGKPKMHMPQSTDCLRI